MYLKRASCVLSSEADVQAPVSTRAQTREASQEKDLRSPRTQQPQLRPLWLSSKHSGIVFYKVINEDKNELK